MHRLALPDADLLSDTARIGTARALMYWAGYCLAHVTATRTTHRARVDLSIATDSTREALAECQVPGFLARPPGLFSTTE
jgi:hypothetical protein